MKHCARWVAFTLGLVAGCANPPAAEPQEIEPALEARVLDSVPGDIPNRTFLDFEGKLHLIGYSLQPAGVAPPGSQVKLTLYWQSVTPLGDGWSLFTHVLGPGGKQLHNLDNVGPLRQLRPDSSGEQRQALPPSRWVPGKVYVDEQIFDMPRDVASSEVTIAVGVWRENARLEIVGGASDGHNRGIVAHVPTGLVIARPTRTPES